MNAPETVTSHNHKFTIAGIDFYLVVGFRDGGEVCLLHVHNNREDCSAFSVLLDVATEAIGYGMPLEHVCDTLKAHEFWPDGVTNNERIPFARSVPDYVGRYIESNFIKLPLVKQICIETYPGIDPWKAMAENNVLLMDLTVGELRQRLSDILGVSQKRHHSPPDEPGE